MIRFAAPAVAATLWMSAAGAALAQGAIEERLDALGSAVRPVPVRAVLPRQIDLTGSIPPPRSQGDTQSCVSWSAVYGAATHALRRSQSAVPALSPSYTYNQVANDPYCQSGTRVSTTLDLLRDVGALPLDAYAFDGGWCGRRPSAAERAAASRYRIRGWRAFDAANPDRVRTELADGRVVIFTVAMGDGLRAHKGTGVFAKDDPTEGRHAMLVVGYDDAKQAFRIQNSWGRSWGDEGYAWFGYDYWRAMVQAAFVIE